MAKHQANEPDKVQPASQENPEVQQTLKEEAPQEEPKQNQVEQTLNQELPVYSLPNPADKPEEARWNNHYVPPGKSRLKDGTIREDY